MTQVTQMTKRRPKPPPLPTTLKELLEIREKVRARNSARAKQAWANRLARQQANTAEAK
jgi:hypothetical protein